jgi:hypothetical protein
MRAENSGRAGTRIFIGKEIVKRRDFVHGTTVGPGWRAAR